MAFLLVQNTFRISDDSMARFKALVNRISTKNVQPTLHECENRNVVI